MCCCVYPSLFDQKQLFVKEEVAELERKIGECQRQIEKAETEVFESVQELNEFYEGKREEDYWGNKTLTAELQRELDKRKKNIELRDKSPALKLQVEQYQKRMAGLNGATLKEIITRDNINRIFSLTSKNELGIVCCFEEVKGNDYFDLLKYLIREGYIDESYNDYMTYFYEGSSDGQALSSLL